MPKTILATQPKIKGGMIANTASFQDTVLSVLAASAINAIQNSEPTSQQPKSVPRQFIKPLLAVRVFVEKP
jgi:hypothetical protein